MEQINTALVLGAGIMGHGIAQAVAMRGVQVLLVDQDEQLLERGMKWIEGNLDYMIKLGEIDPAGKQSTLSRIRKVTNTETAVEKSDFIFEAISENLDLKLDIFSFLDSTAPQDVVIASNTSSYHIDELASAASLHPERVIGVHWFHPPQITPGVEVIPSVITSSEAIDTTFAFIRRIGKYPTQCKSSPGFVGNRIQFAMAAEAFAIVQEGLATPEEVDRIVKSTFGFRLGAFGPFEVSDQAGADTYLAIFQYLYEKLGREQFRPPELLKSQVEAGKYGLKSGSGFYDYGEGAGEKLKRERDKTFYARLHLFDLERRKKAEL